MSNSSHQHGKISTTRATSSHSGDIKPSSEKCLRLGSPKDDRHESKVKLVQPSSVPSSAGNFHISGQSLRSKSGSRPIKISKKKNDHHPKQSFPLKGPTNLPAAGRVVEDHRFPDVVAAKRIHNDDQKNNSDTVQLINPSSVPHVFTTNFAGMVSQLKPDRTLSEVDDSLVDTVSSPATLNAELVPDISEVRARVTQNLTEEIQDRLRREFHTQNGHHAAPAGVQNISNALVDAVAVNKQDCDTPNNSGGTTTSLCGFSRRFWFIFFVLLLLQTMVVVGVILGTITVVSRTESSTETQNEVLTCIVVIDENGGDIPTEEWAYFRTVFPKRPMCLLHTLFLDSGTLGVPSDFYLEGINTYSNVTQGIADVFSTSDWFEICKLEKVRNAGINHVVLFIDNSGNMATERVRSAYDLFEQRTKEGGGMIILLGEDPNGSKDYITPCAASYANLNGLIT